MINVKRSIFWASLYLLVVFVLAQADYFDRPIINFASYFYLMVMIAIPVTLFFPSIARAPVYVPLLVWGGIYLILLQVLDRSQSAEALDFAVIVVEFILLELGVWLMYRLAVDMHNAETLMDSLALGAFPSRARDIDVENRQIKTEFARCRRYNRPLSLIVLTSQAEEGKPVKKMLSSIQHDLSYHFQSARVAQIIDEHIRQTDLILKERKGRFVILCPDTERNTAILLVNRIARTIQDKTGFQTHWGVAVFPSDVLTFEDLLQKAHQELISSVSHPAESARPAEDQ